MLENLIASKDRNQIGFIVTRRSQTGALLHYEDDCVSSGEEELWMPLSLLRTHLPTGVMYSLPLKYSM